MSQRGRIIICEKCSREARNAGKGLCRSCYGTQYRASNVQNVITCSDCQESKTHYAKGRCFRCYTKMYQKDHLAEHAEQERRRRAANPNHVRALDRARNQTGKRKKWKRTYHQSYYVANKPNLLAYQSRYRRADPGRNNNYKRARRARVMGLPATLTVQQWEELLTEYNHCCAYCGDQSPQLEREHKLPAIRGGGYTKENIVPACPTCNRRKRTMDDEEFRRYLAEYPR